MQNVINQGSYDSKADLWSIGVVFYEMLYGINPFFGISIQQIIDKIRIFGGFNLPFADNLNLVSNCSKDLLARLLQPNPDQRIEWDAFFNHPALKVPDTPQEIRTQTRHQPDIGAELKEIEFRYTHEKNKIQFILLTVKKLRQMLRLE